MLPLYNLLSFIALLLYFPWLLFKKGPENRRIFISERLGASKYNQTDIWVHAVSVGEVLACLPFLKKLRKEFPGRKITLSTTTYTGQKIAHERFPEADRIMYMPIDTGLCVRRAVNMLRPEIFITIETELWPALFLALKKTGSRVIILNGRISNRSFRGYKKIRPIMKKFLSNVDSFCMQGEGDAERIIALGAESRKVSIIGNFKFDIDFDSVTPLTLAWLEPVKGGILLAASTHRGEEEIILDAYKSIKNKVKGIKLIIAPRHPERFDEAAELIEKKGIGYIRRSQIRPGLAVHGHSSDKTGNGHRTPDNGFPDIILMDTIGELSRVFSKAAVAFIGGSLVPLGGHNVMEPAYWSRPIIFGPYMDNFPIAGEFLDRSAALQVKDSKDISEATIELLTDPEKALVMGRNARAIVDKNTGAVKKAIDIVKDYLGTV